MSEPIEVPAGRLSAEALRAVIEDFVTREGTDYGQGSPSLETKVDQVLRQLRAGEAAIVFDPETETTTVALRRDLDRARLAAGRATEEREPTGARSSTSGPPASAVLRDRTPRGPPADAPPRDGLQPTGSWPTR